MSPKFSKDEMDSTADLRRLKDGKRYVPYLNYRKTAMAIQSADDHFAARLSKRLNLLQVPGPLMVLSHTGVNDLQQGATPIVSPILDVTGKRGEIVRSLAKWKRLALDEHAFAPGEGLFVEMKAIWQDESLDNTHSVFVEQWDWEKVIKTEQRGVPILLDNARQIYEAILETEQHICDQFRELPAPFLPEEMKIIHTEELEELYPDLSPQEREDEICKEEGAVFLVGIGSRSYESRSCDHDDWSTRSERGVGLNGDLIFWHPILQASVEILSMGVRVNGEALLKQLQLRDAMDRAEAYYHQRVIRGDIVDSLGGGIGRSRLNMFFLRKAHIGEVQVAIWPDAMTMKMADRNVPLLSDAPGLVEGHSGPQRKRRRWLFPM